MLFVGTRINYRALKKALLFEESRRRIDVSGYLDFDRMERDKLLGPPIMGLPYATNISYG